MSDSDTEELDERALGLHSTSFSLMVLAVLFLFSGTLCYVRRNKNYDDEDDFCAESCGEFVNALLLAIVHGIALLSFSISGLFSVIGCIIVATKFSASELGYSFYLCLTAGCLIILGTIFACIMFCKFVVIKKKSNDETIRRSGTMSQSGGNGRSRSRGGASSVNSYTESGGVAPYEPRQAHVKYEAQHATAHRSVFIDDDEYEGIVDVLLAGGIIALFTLAIAGAVKDR